MNINKIDDVKVHHNNTTNYTTLLNFKYIEDKYREKLIEFICFRNNKGIQST